MFIWLSKFAYNQLMEKLDVLDTKVCVCDISKENMNDNFKIVNDRMDDIMKDIHMLRDTMKRQQKMETILLLLNALTRIENDLERVQALINFRY